MKRGWKVLRRTDSGLCSINYSPGMVTYRPGHRTMPRRGCGPLAVFRAYEAAASFRRSLTAGRAGGDYVIFRCSYTPWPLSKPQALWTTTRYVAMLAHLPRGTVLASSVILDPEPYWRTRSKKGVRS